jgi:signal transduction histidine kinase
MVRLERGLVERAGVRPVTFEQSDYPRLRAERVITAGRLLLAVFLPTAVELDPTAVERYGVILHRFSLIYLGYAVAVALVIWLRRSPPRDLPLVTHVADLVVFSAMLHFSAVPTSPFFVYLIFATVCGALRWHARGALLTGAAALVVFVALTIAGRMDVLVPDEFERTRFVTRVTQLAVITGLLAYLGAYQRRLQAEIASLAAWPRRLPADESAAVRDVLTHAAAILRVPRIVLVWQEGDEPGLRLAVRERERFDMLRERPDAFGTIVAETLQHSSFLCDDASRPAPFVVYRVPGGFDSFRSEPLDAALMRRFQVTSVLVLRIVTDTIEGRLIALDRNRLAVDDILLGDIVGRLVAGALEQQALITQLREAAVAEERLRLARELHDGVLQSLTAVSMHVDRLRLLPELSAHQVQYRLSALEEAIAAEQRGLRQFLDDLRPSRGGGRLRVSPIGRLREVTTRLERQWEVRISCECDRDIPAVPAGLVHELARMTEEAVVNGIRHGGATELRVGLEAPAPGRLRLVVSYRGRGFSTFEGRFDLRSLTRMGTGPRSLMERVAAVGGDLVIDSDDTGASVGIVVPVRDQP